MSSGTLLSRLRLCEDKAIVFPMVSKLEIWEDNIYGEPIVVSDAQSLRELSALRPSSRL
jgi:hypothetical protein